MLALSSDPHDCRIGRLAESFRALTESHDPPYFRAISNILYSVTTLFSSRLIRSMSSSDNS